MKARILIASIMLLAQSLAVADAEGVAWNSLSAEQREVLDRFAERHRQNGLGTFLTNHFPHINGSDLGQAATPDPFGK